MRQYVAAALQIVGLAAAIGAGFTIGAAVGVLVCSVGLLALGLAVER